MSEWEDTCPDCLQEADKETTMLNHTPDWNDDSEELAWYRAQAKGLNPAAYRACVEAAEEAKRQVLSWEQGEAVTKQNLNELFQTLREALNAAKAD